MVVLLIPGAGLGKERQLMDLCSALLISVARHAGAGDDYLTHRLEQIFKPNHDTRKTSNKARRNGTSLKAW